MVALKLLFSGSEEVVLELLLLSPEFYSAGEKSQILVHYQSLCRFQS